MARVSAQAVATAQRLRLAGDLRATGLEVHPAWPDRLAPPCIVLAPGTPWVDGGPNADVVFGEVRCRLDVHIVAAVGGTEDSLSALEDALEAVLMHTLDWAIEMVDAPSLLSVGGADYLGTTLTLSQPYRLPETL